MKNSNFTKFFVSSTFLDMHQERDELLKKIFPAFREAANAHGTDAEMIELRWGVNTEGLKDEALVSRVVGTCLHEIDRSRPFLLCYISERRGWVLPRKFITKEIVDKFVPEDIADQSVTELELAYSLKKNSEPPRCIICIRDLSETDIPGKFHNIYFDDDEDNPKKLEALKNWLREEFRDSIIEYTADFNPTNERLENFRVKDKVQTPLADAILAKLKEKFNDEWVAYEKLNLFQRTLKSSKTFVSNRADLFVERKELVADLKAKLLKSQCLILRGLPGMGKTSIACKLANDLFQLNQNVCFIPCGTSAQNSESKFILQQMIFFLEHEVLKMKSPFVDSTGYEKCKSYFFSLCKRIPPAVQIYLFFDSVEKIGDEQRKTLDFIPTTCRNVHCLITCVSDYEIPAKFFNPAISMQDIINKLDDETVRATFRREENAADDVELEEITRKKLMKFCTLFMNLSEAQAEQFVAQLSQGDLIQKAVEMFKQSAANSNETMPFVFLVEDIAELESNEVLPILSAMLDRKGKTLYPQTAAVVLNKKNVRTPLYLELIDQLLNMIQSEDLLKPKFSGNPNLITVDKVNAMFEDPEGAVRYVLKEAIQKLCLNQKEITETVNLLATSRHGLRENDLRDLLGTENFKQLDWATLRRFLNKFFVERDTIDLTSDIIRTDLRAAIPADKFTSLEKKIGKHIEQNLAPDDFLRRAEGMYYAKILGRYEFAVELFAQAFRTKDALLSATIYSVLCEDDGVPFAIECLKHIKTDDEQSAECVLSFFMGNDFDKMMIGDSNKSLQSARDLYATFSEIFAENDKARLYQKIRAAQAIYELRLGNVEIAQKLYEEILHWGEENFKMTSRDLDSCRLLSTCCDQLAEFATNKGDIASGQRYAEENVRWSRAARNIDKKENIYTILTAVKETALAIRKNHGKATEEILKLSRRVYEMSRKAFNPYDFTSNALLCKACGNFINVNISLDKDEEALAVATEGLDYAQNLVRLDANNLEVVKIAATLLREITIAELKNHKFKRATEHGTEATWLLIQAYSQNSTKELATLLSEMTVEFLEIIFADYQRATQKYLEDPQRKNFKRLEEITEAAVSFQNNAILAKLSVCYHL